MNCKEVEQEIYLYSELRSHEKTTIDVHIKQCAACQELFATVQVYQAMAGDLANDKPEIRNHARLTSNIMQAVTQSAQKKNSFSMLFDSIFIRSAFVAASFALAIFFTAEQLLPGNAPDKKMSIVQTVTLNSTSVAEILQGQKEKRNVSLRVCLKTGACASTLIENFKQKKF